MPTMDDDAISAKTLFTVHSENQNITGGDLNKAFICHEERDNATDGCLKNQSRPTQAPQSGTQRFLRITMDDIHTPNSPESGFVFGRETNICDILLGPYTDGRVSRKQFSIWPNWKTGVLILMNLSAKGTKLTTSLRRRILAKEGKIFLKEKQSVNVDLDFCKIQIRVPDHDNHRAAFLENLAAFYARVEVQPPSIHGLAIGNKTARRTLETDFVIGKQIGHGSQARVFEATEKATGQLCAIKRFNKMDTSSFREALVSGQLVHKHIIRYIFQAVYSGEQMIQMELGGPDLHEVQLIWPLSHKEIKMGLSQLFDAMVYFHGKGITHRDIKPGNIIVHERDSSGIFLKITDFGHASPTGCTPRSFLGTNQYLAPEVDLSRRGYTNKVDIWSMGILTVELIYGLPDWPEHTEPGDAQWYMVLDVHLDSEDSETPEWEFIDLMLKENPQSRPSAKVCLQHPFLSTPENPPQNPIPVGPPATNMAQEQTRLIREVIRAAPLPVNLDGGGPVVELVETVVNKILLRLGNPHLATTENEAIEPSGYDNEASDLSTIILDPSAPRSPDNQFEPASNGATEDSNHVDSNSREYHSTIDDNAGSSIESQSEGSQDAQSFDFTRAPRSRAFTPGAHDDPNGRLKESPSEGLVYITFGHAKPQRVSMRTSDFYLNVTQMCIAAGFESSLKKALRTLRSQYAADLGEAAEIWVPFSVGISFSRKMDYPEYLESLFCQVREGFEENTTLVTEEDDELPSIEEDDELPSIEEDDETPSIEEDDEAPSIEEDDETPVTEEEDEPPQCATRHTKRKLERITSEKASIIKRILDVNTNRDIEIFDNIAKVVSLDVTQVADWTRHYERNPKRQRRS